MKASTTVKQLSSASCANPSGGHAVAYARGDKNKKERSKTRHLESVSLPRLRIRAGSAAQYTCQRRHCSLVVERRTRNAKVPCSNPGSGLAFSFETTPKKGLWAAVLSRLRATPALRSVSLFQSVPGRMVDSMVGGDDLPGEAGEEDNHESRAGCSWFRPRPSWEGVPSWAR